jgi:type VI secretion system protein ImpM
VPEVAGARGAESAPGLYGKLPARGDFVSRRLDAEFIEAWDGWLQRVVSASREALGERWLESFLSAPVWRFLVPAGMYSKAGWVGLMVPSVDRVGRYFPLTLAAPVLEDSIDVPATLAKALGWLDSVEALALEALAPELDFEDFDRRLAALALPVELAVALPVSDDTVPLGGLKALFQVWQFPAQADEAGMRETLQRGSLGPRASAAMWMTRGGETFAPSLAACGGLIPGGHFCALLDGRWAEHSWTLIPEAAPAATADIANVTYCPPILPGVDLIHGQGGGEVGKAGPLTASPSSEHGRDMSSRLEK